MTIALQQLLHGYSHGHSLLAASTTLDSRDLDLIARLSDLSGSLGPSLVVTTYLTLYPLPSNEWYVIARTWPDEHAPRAGCVLTHSLLVPLAAWANEVSPLALLDVHKLPGDSLEQYRSPIEYDPNTFGRASDSVMEPMGGVFAQKYFGEGLTPLVWIGARNAELACLRIADALWPSLKLRFASCTRALQPRTLGERPFDLHFAPSEALSRFSEYSRDHVIDGLSTIEHSKLEDAWSRELSNDIFGRVSEDRQTRIRDLSRDLDPYPTSIRRVYLLLELEERIPGSPVAAVGALDLLESLAPAASSASDEKRRIARNALEAIAKEEGSRSLELLYLLDQRLGEPSFSPDRLVIDRGRALVERAFHSQPELSINACAILSNRQAPRSSPFFFAAVASATKVAVINNPELAASLFPHESFGELLLFYCPDAASAFLKLTNIHRPKAIEALVTWCHALRSEPTRTMIRAAVLPEIRELSDVPILEELLKDAGSTEIPSICKLIEQREVFRSRSFVEIVGQLIGERHPIPVQEWCSENHWSSYQIAALLSYCFSLTPEGFASLQETEDKNRRRRGLVLAAYLARTSSYAIPDWLQRALEGSYRTWIFLLAAADEPEVAAALLLLVRSLPRSAIARDLTISEHLQSVPGSLGEVLRPYAATQVIRDFLMGVSNTEQLRQWLVEAWVQRVLTIMTGDTLASLIRELVPTSQEAWLRAWELISAVAGYSLKFSGQLTFVAIGSILAQPSRGWSHKVAETWADLLTKTEIDDAIHLDLCDQALRFSLQHRHLPLDIVVAESFFSVHKAVMDDSVAVKSWRSFWGFGEWDRAKELRSSLVDAFVHSDWRPELFVLAAKEEWLARKLCKRMRRQWRGEQFLERAYSALGDMATPRARTLVSVVADVLKYRSQHDDWD
jgi:hypothetical protein